MEVEKTMDILDELDNTLLNRNFQIKDSIISESKKNVKLKESEENDQFDDLNLSDDFQISLNNKPDVTKDKKIAHLFGLEQDHALNLPVGDDLTPNKSSIKNLVNKPQVQESNLAELDFHGPSTLSTSRIENQTQKSIPKMKSIFSNENDVPPILNDKVKISNSQAKKSLIEEMFGNSSRSNLSTKVNKNKSTSNLDIPVSHSYPEGGSTGLINEVTTDSSTPTGFSLSASKEPRKGRRAPTILQNDPLGVLSRSDTQIDKSHNTENIQNQAIAAEITTKASVTEDLPEWLGGPKMSKEEKHAIETTTKNEVLSRFKSTETLSKTLADTGSVTIRPECENVDQSGLTTKILGIEFDQQAAILNMQQQEHELRTAAALSQYSNKLNYLMESQKIKFMDQEKQFNMLIERHLERQTLLEAQIKSQQDRINSYIQNLTVHPTGISVMAPHQLITKNDKHNVNESTDNKELESESLLHKIQLEKQYLENTLESLKEKHVQEMLILEDSYKKQITFLEEAMVQMEKRMQDDMECLEADYKLKIEKLKGEIFENEKSYKTEKEALKKENTKLIHEIRERHFTSLEVLQKEHIETIQRITQTKESERIATEIMKSDGTNVENLLNKSEAIITNLEELQKKFEINHNKFLDSEDNHLLIQEKNIEYLKDLLEKQKDTFTEEKQKLMSTIQKLELHIAELTKEFQKQNAVFKSNEDTFKIKEQSLIKEREIFIEQSTWERDRLQAMRDAWTKEEDRQLELISQERQFLAIERGKLQIFNKLKTGIDESSKIELEATIKAAQDAASCANEDRLKWQQKINELEIQKSALQEKEKHLIFKAKELQEFTQSALAKRNEGLQALKEAHFIEVRYKEKLTQLQIQEEILTQRESKLASEKLELARERLKFRISEAEKPEEDIISNKINYEDKSTFSELPSSMQNTTNIKDSINPQLLLLKWDLDNKLQNNFSTIAS